MHNKDEVWEEKMMENSFVFRDVVYNQHENLKFKHHMLETSQLKPKQIKTLWKHYLQSYRHFNSDSHLTAALAYELYKTQITLQPLWQQQMLNPDKLLTWVMQVKKAVDHNGMNHAVLQNLTDAEILQRIRDTLLTKNVDAFNKAPPTDITTVLNSQTQHLFDLDYCTQMQTSR